ncbi:Rod shape-determining protein MreD [Anaerovibrio sp. JC8]|uniref:rod shape-determining protein MreD n=1 Tax=Anaerovibrio sp. JC8 TaxID=1240085 RepID=UPI000A0CFE44|nr:rod shape-determining protein MreD [Anaerovibrio sp. JC8]ORU01254.1 Rod shape-determining protein MreD [Anaerovibrio sp. JC8]
MKTFLAWLLFVLVVYAFQSAFMPMFYFYGTGPDLILLMTSSVALLNGKKVGSFAGFILGLFQDLATGTFFGLNAFTKMLVGYVCGIFSTRVLKDSFGLPVTAAILTSPACFFMTGAIMLLLGYRFNLFTQFYTKLGPLICYNLVFAWPIHCAVRWLHNKTADKK